MAQNSDGLQEVNNEKEERLCPFGSASVLWLTRPISIADNIQNTPLTTTTIQKDGFNIMAT